MLSYIHQDHLGSTVAASNSNGSLTSTIAYFPFGDCLKSTGDLASERLFTGQILDDNTGLYYYNARYYDPEIGRFISADSKVPNPMNPQALNRYAYCINNPLKYTDPTGHGWWSIAIDIASIAFDIYELSANPSLGNAGLLALDVVLTCLPVVPAGVGPVVKGVTKVVQVVGKGEKIVKGVDKVVEGSKLIDKSLDILGKADELGAIKNHLSGLDHAIENDAMIQRIGAKIEKGEALTGADANFYNHELYEKGLMDQGWSYESAHQAALEKYNMCEWDLYDPSAVQIADEANGGWRSFNDAYYDYWGIE